MASIVSLVKPVHPSGSFSRGSGRVVGDLLGGALLLGAWLALWTVTWAAVAGPLAPIDPLNRAAAVEQAIAGS